MSKFYTQNGWEGSKFDRSLSTNEIAKRIREDIKKDKELSKCKFSVTCHHASMCSSIDITLLEAPQNALLEGDRWKWSEYGYHIINKVKGIVKAYRYSDCDGMIDYFDTNFYEHYNIGTYEKPFKVVEPKQKVKEPKTANEQETNISGEYKLIDYSEKAFAIIGDTKAIKDTLKENGGRFNPRLSCGAGWIFSKKKQSEIETLLNL